MNSDPKIFAKDSTFAKDWADAWNAHDIENVLIHFHDDAVFTSPFARKVLPETDGKLVGKAAIRDYWTLGLRLIPNLHFTVKDVFVGVDHLVILYENQNGVSVSEVLRFKDGKVVEGHGTYPPAILNPTGSMTPG